jgi:hypothetical protein
MILPTCIHQASMVLGSLWGQSMPLKLRQLQSLLAFSVVAIMVKVVSPIAAIGAPRPCKLAWMALLDNKLDDAGLQQATLPLRCPG